jgi:F-type H+-transporting ATPase subunit a
MSIYGFLEPVGIPVVVQAAILATLILVLTGFLLKRQLAVAADEGVVPDDGVSLRNVLELVVDGMAGLARDNMGDEWQRWFPLVGTSFFFILISNLLGLFPGLGGATSYVETTTAWAIITVLTAEFVGMQKHGFGYIKHFLGPVWWLAPVFLVLEIPLHLARVLTLSVRLLANMFADHTIVAAWLGLVPLVIPAVFMGLGLVVAILQAFVFALLTMIYIGLALEEAH